MSRLLPLLAALTLTGTLGTAQAQVKIGSVTLSKPSTPAPTTTRQTSRVGSAPGTSSTGSKSSMSNVPAGWYEVRGRISAAVPVTLPAGSSVSVYMENQTTRGQFVRIQFKTSRLSTPYQIIFSPGRLNSNHRYTIRATVTDSTGKVLYQSAALNVPNAARNTIDLSVR